MSSGVFNDIAVAARVALEEYPERCNLNSPILVVDLDVHQVGGMSSHLWHFEIGILGADGGAHVRICILLVDGSVLILYFLEWRVSRVWHDKTRTAPKWSSLV